MARRSGETRFEFSGSQSTGVWQSHPQLCPYTVFFRKRKKTWTMETVPELKTGSIDTLKCPGQKPLAWGGRGSPGKQNQQGVHKHTETHPEGAAPASGDTEKPRDLQAVRSPSGPPRPGSASVRGREETGEPAPAERGLARPPPFTPVRLPADGATPTRTAGAVFTTPPADPKVHLFQRPPHGHAQTCCSTSFLGAPWPSRVGTQS